jgi:tight adherence protein B
MSGPLITLLTFVAVAMAVAGTYSILSDLFLRDRTRANNRVDEEFRRKLRDRAERSTLFKNLGQLAAEIEADGPGHLSLAQRFTAMIDQSGLDTTPRKVLSLAIGIGLAAGCIVGLVKRDVIFTVAAVGIVGPLPIAYVAYQRKARMDKLRSQLPDAFELMSRVIRAGQTMSQAMLAVADEFPPPISAEFSYCYEQQNLGLPPEAAYRDLARRTDLIEIKLFVLALLVQQQTGGNLAELIDKLAGVLRERARIRGVVQALTAEGRMQAIVLLSMPPALFIFMLFLNADYAKTLLTYPKLIWVTLGCEGLGAVWIRKIVNFEY